MEPNEYSHVSVVKAEGKQIFPASTELKSSDGILSTLDSHSQAAQNFYPQFYRDSPPLGHSRPYFTASLDNTPKYLSTRSFDQSILGSGDFGIMRGGTFYSEDEASFHQKDNNDYNLFYGDNSSSGNGRTETYTQRFTFPEEQFANFRDFADINTPSDSAYSQFVVVYANKNSTSHHPNPKNIFEQLLLLDKDEELEQKKNRLSTSKVKLAATKLEKKYNKKIGPKDQNFEPLLALS